MGSFSGPLSHSLRWKLLPRVTATRTGGFFSRVPENWRRSNRRAYSGPAHGASSSGSSGSSSSSSSAAVVGNVGATQGSASQANRLLPGATVATLLMLGALHARRLYEDSKIEEQKRQGKELEFAPDWKATFLQVLPLRFISRVWGSMTSLELPLWARHYVYKGWARAFNSNLEEMSRPLEDYTSLREFFTRELKEGVRPLASGPACLLSPVDGIMIRCGEVRGSGTMIEQVKGFSYSVSALLGATPPPLALAFSESETSEQNGEKIKPDVPGKPGKRRWSSLWSTTKTLQPVISDRSAKGLFYCVLYLGPGDYHRIHSPSDWQIYHRRHFAGKLYPVNNRAVRTIKNLYVVNERVVLEGKWSQGLMAMAAVGATNVGSIELKFEPELKTNVPIFGKDVHSVINTCTYGEKGEGLTVKGGDEVAIFNLGSTVVLVFQAPASCVEDNPSQKPVEGFTFIVQNGERVKVGQALGQW